MSGKRILLIGGGAHCRSVIDCIADTKDYSDIGIVDINIKRETSELGFPIVGTDSDLPELFAKGWSCAFIAIGITGSTEVRQKAFDNLKKIGFIIPVIADPSAVISRNAVIGEGTFIGKKAVINTRSRTGCCTIINTAAVIEHDCVIGDFSHISPGAVLCGGVTVEKGVHIGAGSTAIQGIRIGENSLIGAGSVIVKSIPKNVEAFGNPCRIIKKL